MEKECVRTLQLGPVWINSLFNETTLTILQHCILCCELKGKALSGCWGFIIWSNSCQDYFTYPILVWWLMKRESL